MVKHGIEKTIIESAKILFRVIFQVRGLNGTKYLSIAFIYSTFCFVANFFYNFQMIRVVQKLSVTVKHVQR